MKKLFKSIFIFLAILGTTSLTTTLAVRTEAYADNCDRSFLGLMPWDCNTGLTTPGQKNDTDLKNGIVIAGANIIIDISIIASYLVLGYVIYGGYLYTFSGGDPGKVANGKKTLTQAFIGLAIVMSANIILNSIHIALVGNSGAFNCTGGDCVNPGEMITNLISWVTGIAGVVAVIFVVYGGISYTTSSGDPAKTQKAKQTIIYSLIGLAIVGLSITITSFVSNMIKSGSENSNGSGSPNAPASDDELLDNLRNAIPTTNTNNNSSQPQNNSNSSPQQQTPSNNTLRSDAVDL